MKIIIPIWTDFKNSNRFPVQYDLPNILLSDRYNNSYNRQIQTNIKTGVSHPCMNAIQ